MVGDTFSMPYLAEMIRSEDWTILPPSGDVINDWFWCMGMQWWELVGLMLHKLLPVVNWQDKFLARFLYHRKLWLFWFESEPPSPTSKFGSPGGELKTSDLSITPPYIHTHKLKIIIENSVWRCGDYVMYARLLSRFITLSLSFRLIWSKLLSLEIKFLSRYFGTTIHIFLKIICTVLRHS